MTKDEDRRYYVDYFAWASVLDVIGAEDDYYAAYLFDIANFIRPA